MDKLLAKLSQQQAAINQQHEALRSSDDSITYSRTVDYVSASSSTPITPELTEPYNGTTANSSSSEVGKVRYIPNIGELARLKFELEAAKGKIARMDQELAQTRITKHTLDQAIGSASEADFSFINIPAKDFHNFQPSRNGPPLAQHENSWAMKDDNRSDTSDSLSAGGFNRSRNIWGNVQKSAFNGAQTVDQPFQQPSSTLDQAQYIGRHYSQPYVDTSVSYATAPVNGFRSDRILPETELMMNQTINRRAPIGGRFSNRSNGLTQYSSSNCSFDGFANNSVGGISGSSITLGAGLNQNMTSNMNLCNNYHPLPIGTPLSPHAPEFTSSSSNWKGDVCNNFAIFLFLLISM